MIESHKDYMAIESGNDWLQEISNSTVHWRWSDHNVDGQYLEVQCVDGWQQVYPLVKKEIE